MAHNQRDKPPSPTTIPYCLGIDLQVSPHLQNRIIATFLDPRKGWMFAVRVIAVAGDTAWADGLLVSDPESVEDANVREAIYELLALTNHCEFGPATSKREAHQRPLPGDHPVRIQSGALDLLELALTNEKGQVIDETYMIRPATWQESRTYTGTHKDVPDKEVKEQLEDLNTRNSLRRARAQANVDSFKRVFPDSKALLNSLINPGAIVPELKLNGDDAGLELHLKAEAGHAGKLLCLVDRWLGLHDLPRGARLEFDGAGRTMAVSLGGPAPYLFLAWLRHDQANSTA